MKTHIVQPTQFQLQHYVSIHVSFSNTKEWMRPQLLSKSSTCD